MLDCQLDQHGNPPPPKNHKQQSSSRMPAIISPCQANEIAKLKAQDRTGPDPWFVRKFAVGIVAALFVYSYYVYVARLCVPMLRLDSNRLGGRAQGLAYIVICNVLFVMTLWSYITVTTTSPGYARDYVPQTDPPPEDAEYITVAGPPFSPRPHTTEEDLRSDLDLDDDEGEETLEMSEQRRRSSVMSTASRRSGGVVAEEDAIAETAPSAGAVGPSLASTLLPPLSATTSIPHTSAPLPSSPVDDSVSPGRLLDAEIDAAAERERERDRCQSTSSTVAASSTVTFPPQAHLLSSQHPRKLSSTPSSSFPLPLPSGARPSSDSATPSYLHFPEPDTDWEPVVQLKVERVPQKVPVLTEQYRYDTREGLLRPVRSHRCRHCAKVVLKMDHHCPWIGTCVGARNYKYFYNFLQSSSFYTLFLFLTLLISLTLPLSSPPPSSSSSSTTPYRYPRVDGHLIAIIAISFLFFLFTGSLFAAHTRLVLRNMTTIEEIGMNRIKQRERASLRQVYGFWGWRAKRANQKAWDVQWGRHGREGNLWWLGSRRKNWESVMGRGKWGWFLPIPPSPRQETPGLHYEPNPRFSKEGIWRPRREWPKELR